MRACVQRVRRASVEVEGRIVGQIDRGLLVLLGVAEDDDQGTNSGSVFVYRFNGSTWVEQAKLLADGGSPYDGFGVSVGIAGDTMAVGAHLRELEGMTDRGTVYLYGFDGSAWVETDQLIASDGWFWDRFEATSFNKFFRGLITDDADTTQSSQLIVELFHYLEPNSSECGYERGYFWVNNVPADSIEWFSCPEAGETSVISSRARSRAMLVVRMAGCWISVRRNSSSGPSKQIRERGNPSVASAVSKVERAAGDASQASFPIPTSWDPWPGKRSASIDR